MKKKKLKLKKGTAENISKTIREQGKSDIYSDVDGSYTGTGKSFVNPVQDADDL